MLSRTECIEKIANEWKTHVDISPHTLARSSLGEQIRLSLASSFDPPLSLSRAHVSLPSTHCSLSTLSNGCASPFCIRDTYHLRVRRPQNRSVSRNNTRCHGHPSTRAHTNVRRVSLNDQKLSTRADGTHSDDTFFVGIYQLGKSSRSGTDQRRRSFFLSPRDRDRFFPTGSFSRGRDTVF